MRPVLILAALAAPLLFIQQAIACPPKATAATQRFQATEQTTVTPGAVTQRRIPQPPIVTPQPDLIVTEQQPDIVTTTRSQLSTANQFASTSTCSQGIFDKLRSKAQQVKTNIGAKVDAFQDKRALRRATSASVSRSSTIVTTAPAVSSSAFSTFSQSSATNAVNSAASNFATSRAQQAAQGSVMRSQISIDGQPVFDESAPYNGPQPNAPPAPVTNPAPFPAPTPQL